MQQRCGAASKTSCQDTRVQCGWGVFECFQAGRPMDSAHDKKLDAWRRVLASAHPLGEGLRCSPRWLESCMLTNPLFGHRPGCSLESRSLIPRRPSYPTGLLQNHPHPFAKLTSLIFGPEEQAVRLNLAFWAGSEINQNLVGVWYLRPGLSSSDFLLHQPTRELAAYLLNSSATRIPMRHH